MSGPVRPPLTVETVDGLTSGRPITKIKVSNGDLTVSGNTATIDTSGSGGTPGGSDTEIQYNNAGAFGGDAGLKITTKGGGNTTTIRSGNMLLGGGKVATASANGFVSIISDGTGQIILTSGADQGGTFADTQVNIFANTNTDNAILNFRDSSNIENGRITLKGDGNLEIKNSVSGKNVFLEVAGSAGVTVKQATTDTDAQLTVEGNGTGTPKLSLTNSTKAVTLLCDTNQKLKVEGGTDSFVFDVSSATGGITFPDGTTQTTAASGVSFPLLGSDGSAGAPTYSFSSDTDTGLFRPATGQIGFTMDGSNKLSFGSAGEILIGGSAAGTSGQVLTSGGSGSAMSWADAAGGGSLPKQPSAENVNDSAWDHLAGNRFYGNSTSNGTVNVGTSTYFAQFVAYKTGNVSTIGTKVSTALSGVDMDVGIYDTDSDGLPDNLLGKGTLTLSSTGVVSTTSLSATISLTAGETYYYGFVRTAGDSGAVIVATSNNSSAGWSNMGLSSNSMTSSNTQTLYDIGTSLALPSSVTPSDLYASSNGRAFISLKY